jgi:hypothetical protein
MIFLEKLGGVVGKFIFANHFSSFVVEGPPARAFIFLDERYSPSWLIAWVATKGGELASP